MIKNIHSVPVSMMTFMLYTGVNDDDKNRIYKELKRRLSNGSSIDMLMEYETDSFKRRGTNLEDYLFQDRPTAQLLMELYFTQVYNQVHEFGNLTYSEVMLCNKESKNKFFDKVIRLELKNIQKRLNDNNFDFMYHTDEFKLLQDVYKALKARYNYNPCGWEEDSLISCVDDTLTAQSSLVSEKMMLKAEAKFKKREENRKSDKPTILDFIDMVKYGIIFDSDFLNAANEKLVANRELRVLRAQRHSIFASMKNNPIDYSFIRKQNIIK